MNKPAPKEPSMDEILSSIRQIIADDDATVPRRPSAQAAPPPMQATPARPALAPAPAANRDLNDMLEDVEPLALSSSQILDDQDDDDPMAGLSFNPIAAVEEEEPIAFAPRAFVPPELVEAEDITFDIAEPEPETSFAAFLAPEPEATFEAEAEEPAFTAPPAAAFRPQPSVAQAAPMPDPTLSSDMAEQLIEPATQSAVRSSITKLNRMGLGNSGATIESLMRDMLRPMLKEWLDENLPSVVERMVEKEIARVSRGD
ncbi:cell pole-organizing protein PopZ [Devosia sp. UYZn731]|uniref:PopZ family protein n=1 Tax=Devosia sp. UYZn731 TaxID=3156345 RepID=UPI0033939BC3